MSETPAAAPSVPKIPAPSVATTPSQWREILMNTPVQFLLQEKKTEGIFLLNHDATLRDAASGLANHKFLSAPVFDNEKHLFLGFIDVIDIAGYIVNHWRSYSQKFDTEHFPAEEFFNDPVSKVVNFSKIDFPCVIPEKASLADLLELFVNPIGSTRLHRVAVVKTPGVISGIVSQSDFVHFMSKYCKIQGSSTIQELGLGKIVVMAFADDPVHKALEIMYDHRISGIGLVDKNFKLVGNLSASDLRGKLPTSFDYFTMNAIQVSQRGTETGKLCAVFGTATLEETLHKITIEKVHRAYVVDSEKRLVGVVTLTDLLRFGSEICKREN